MKKSYILILLVLFLACGRQKKDNISDKSHQINESSALQAAGPDEDSLLILPVDSVPEHSGVSDGMVFLKGGKIRIGSEKGLPNERPVHDVTVNPFYLDMTPVTVGMFRRFISKTGYKTDAEKFGDAGVFNLSLQRWELVKGATWEHPFGPSGPKADDNHPVTQVSWNDAVAYADWADKRLPTEIEWEYAARSGKNSGNRFSWGNEVIINGKYLANVWQGGIAEQRIEDGFLFTSPVGFFGLNDAGLSDMGGNVWNWCSDTYAPYPGANGSFAVNEDVKVIRGGSFFFDQNGEYSFSVSGRSMNSKETSLFNTGFRCARDAD